MNGIDVTHPEIKLAGIKIRTSNKEEFDPIAAKIMPMVQAYFQDSIADKISNRVYPGKIYIVYTEYESDYEGEYTCMIGEEVKSLDNLAEGLSTHVIPAQKYTKFTSEQGEIPKIVIDAWTKIWQMKELDSNRSYLSDFEVYDSRAADPLNAEVDIYVGIR
jgi:predicted transcriptional regulator YdeE